MSDEIDIEEHDLLDDPAIKNIFPDLSKLKKEILDYYDEEPELETASTFETPFLSEVDHENIDVSTALNFLEDESLPRSILLDNLQDSEPEPQHVTTEKTQAQLFENTITLGTNHEERNINTSLQIFGDKSVHPDNIVSNSQDSEVESQQFISEKTQVRLFNHKIILGTDYENSNAITSSNCFGEESVPSVNLLDNSQNNDLTPQHLTNEKTQVQFNNKIILGTDHKDDNVSTSLNDFGNENIPPGYSLDNSKGSELEPKQTTTDNTQLFNNKIILGSKPIPHAQDKIEYYEKNVKPYGAVVKLVEYGDYLNKSSLYCKHCLILFPKQKDFDFHDKNMHLVPEVPPAALAPSVIPVIPLITNTKRNLNEKKLELKENVNEIKCDLCNKIFSFRQCLYRHKKNFHNKTVIAKMSKIKRKNNVVPNQNSKTVLVKNNECFHCKKTFKDQKSLIEHIYSILQKPTSSLITADSNKNNINQKSGEAMINKNKSFPIKNSGKQFEKENKSQKNNSSSTNSVTNKTEKGNKTVNQIFTTNPQTKTSKGDHRDTFYRCHYCSYYFREIKFYAAHIKNKHHLLKVPKVKKVPFNPKCKFCHSILNNAQTFNTHLHKIHSMKIKENVSTAMKKENKINNPKKETNTCLMNKIKSGILDVFRCCYCSYYFNNVKRYATHIMKKHKVQRMPKPKKIPFDPKCKYCPKMSYNIRVYNKHLYGSHSRRINEVFKVSSSDQTSSFNTGGAKNDEKKVAKIEAYNNSTDEQQNSRKKLKLNFVNNAAMSKPINLILKSALFKCNKCDIHFLSLKTAVDHSNHMELLINWKCSICHKIFKRNDKLHHEKQHTLSNIFTVYEISETDVSKVLYKCSKCTIHFDEANYLTHSSDCNLKTPQSTYCNICDILVSKNGIKSHEIKHKKFKPIDFVIIESDFILPAEVNKLNGGMKLKTNTDKISTSTKTLRGRKARKVDYFLTQSFCDTCKCFVSNMGGTRKAHVQSACSHMSRHTCLDCGLTLTSKAMVTHQKLHSIKRDLKLQDYTFFNLRSGKQIKPPIPKYHKCESCNVHFISKIIMRSHLCNEKEYKICQICEIKLSKPIYHLHMAFHSYSLKKTNSTRAKQGQKSSEISKISESNIPTPNKFLKNSSTYFIYTCNNCSTTVNTYDKMIQHCQEHFASINIVPSTKECKICNLNIDSKCYTAHIKLHQALDKIRLENLKYDLFYFRLGNDMWLKHVFGSRPQKQIYEVIKKSIYQFEHRIKMEIVQKGVSDYTMYKCYKCHCFIEADNIYKHMDVMCVKLRKYPCPACGLSFISALSRTNHEKYHERPDFSSKSYRIVMFNRTEDSNFNFSSGESHNYYVFYQCRNCSGVVDKSHRTNHTCIKIQYKTCTYCGLLFNKNEYEPHISKHKTLNSFISENMKVILFGQNNSDKTATFNKSKAFRGIIYDYNFYKCINCQICEKDTKFKHICTDDNSRIKCSKCNIYLYSHALISHLKKHESDPDFEIENMNFIDFDPSALADNKTVEGRVTKIDELFPNEETLHKSKIMSSETDTEIIHEVKDNEDLDAQKTAKFYKCPCGLHFLDEVTVNTHLDQCGSKIKQAKQTCFKCGLLFTPNVLFTHMVTHHGDIKNRFKFDIIDVPKKL